MATLLDTGLLSNFESIFTFLLIFFLAYAGLTKSKVFENNGINSIIAFVVAGITLFFKPATDLIHYTAPWFIVTLVVFFFFLLIFMILGIKTDNILKNEVLKWIIISIGVIILLFGLAEVNKLNQKDIEDCQTEECVSQFQNSTVNVLFHPAVFGVAIFLIIAAFAILFISEE